MVPRTLRAIMDHAVGMALRPGASEDAVIQYVITYRLHASGPPHQLSGEKNSHLTRVEADERLIHLQKVFPQSVHKFGIAEMK